MATFQIKNFIIGMLSDEYITNGLTNAFSKSQRGVSMIAYNFCGIPDNDIHQEVDKEYGNDPEKKSYAQQIAQIAAEYTRQHPIDKGASRRSRRDYRRSARRAIAAKAREQVKPVGMIPGFIFMTVISSIISWFIQMLLRKQFEKEGVTLDIDEEFNDCEE